MAKTEISPGSVEYIYKEYVRLSERCVSYVQSSFDDIKLFGASGLVFVWKPIVDTRFFDGTNKSFFLFCGFLTILLVVIILGIFSLLKQSLVIYYLKHLRAYEAEIRADLGQINKVAFEWTESYSRWRKNVVIRIFFHLLLVVGLTTILFPIVILLQESSPRYAGVYGFISLLLGGIYLNAARGLLAE